MMITNKKSNKKVPLTVTPKKMFSLDISNMKSFMLVANAKNELKLWHLRYGYLDIKGFRLLVDKGMVLGLPKMFQLNCVKGVVMENKLESIFLMEKAWRASKYLELIHVNSCGPMHTTSFSGCCYFLLFTDDCSRMRWVYLLETKSETFQNSSTLQPRLRSKVVCA